MNTPRPQVTKTATTVLLPSSRVRQLKSGQAGHGPVVYWMSRDQRFRDNWALIRAIEHANEAEVPVIAVFTLAPTFLGATLRHYDFMLRGLEEVETALKRAGIGFELLTGDPPVEILKFIRKITPALLVTDFDPLKIKRQWKDAVLRQLTIPCEEVDGHNIVPCWIASPKAEYGAHTIRPKINRKLPRYLTEYPRFRRPARSIASAKSTQWNEIRTRLKVDTAVQPVDWIRPGERAALKALKTFARKGIIAYTNGRNDPNQDAQSGLSPYLHFGQLSAQRVALEVLKSDVPRRSKNAFLEELIIRRELSDNFCFYNRDYDTPAGFPNWARNTLTKHLIDERPYRYRLAELEGAQTHDELWNAAQRQMVYTGKMHGYLRMYWAKKILEWTRTPKEAMAFAIVLNDRYELDGRDPNGYAGIAWSIGGVHDRAWGEREVFGKIRYMSLSGCRSKFSVREYVARWKKRVS